MGLNDKPRRDAYRDRARRLYHRDRGDRLDQFTVHVDEHAEVSKGTNPGAWVQAWIWVPDQPTEEEKRGPQ